MFIGQILYIWIAITEYVQSGFSGPPAFSGPDTCMKRITVANLMSKSWVMNVSNFVKIFDQFQSTSFNVMVSYFY